MRQLIIQVPRGRGASVVEAARSQGATNLIRFDAAGDDGPEDVVFVHVSNAGVEELLGRLQDLPGLRVALIPHGVLTLQPPPSEVPRQVSDVQPRSPTEVFLGGLQSVGSWTAFLGYTAAAGAVAWVGLFTNTAYLLTAAMLIAPFAGPAMNAALATVRGDAVLLGQSLLRYLGALGAAVVEAAALSLILRQAVATDFMVANSQVSAVALLLPLVAGAAGALNLVQSDRNSLVSGAAVGMLVAASLAPPAGLIGMAGAIGRWDMAGSGLFLLLLQLAGINLSGVLVFRAYGLTSRGVRYGRGRSWVFPASLAVSVAALIALLTWQFWVSPGLQRSGRAQRITAEVEDVVERCRLADLVEANVRFTRPDVPGQDTLLAVVYVRRHAHAGVGRASGEVRSELTRAIQERIIGLGYRVRPLVDVRVLDDPPPGSDAGASRQPRS